MATEEENGSLKRSSTSELQATKSFKGDIVDKSTFSDFFSDSDTSSSSDSKEMNSRAHFYSQLSVNLFEKALDENESFPEDLDRVHNWFTRELSDTQKLVCLHDLLSLMTPSQHRFLFTTVAFDSEFTKEETKWLNLGINDQTINNVNINNNNSKNGPIASDHSSSNCSNRFNKIDLTVGESLFSGMNIVKSKLPIEKVIVKQDSMTTLTAKKSILSFSNSESLENQPNTFESFSLTSSSFASCPSESPVNGFSVSSSKFLGLLKLPKDDTSTFTGKAPPGFLSPTAVEFRPSEPSCHSDVYMADFIQWLRLLRLHKYSETLNPIFENDKLALLKMTDEQLENAGVAALGARRKFLRLFERIREEKKIE